jgi:hypothetical protein
MGGGWRYGYVPGIILLSFFITQLRFQWKDWSNRISVLVIFLAMITWIPIYRSKLSPWVNPLWPKWEREVQVWRSNPDYELRIHPQWRNKAGGSNYSPKNNGPPTDSAMLDLLGLVAIFVIFFLLHEGLIILFD